MAAEPPPIEFHAELDSTNAEARRRAEAGEGGPVWIATSRQTAGRGPFDETAEYNVSTGQWTMSARYPGHDCWQMGHHFFTLFLFSSVSINRQAHHADSSS